MLKLFFYHPRHRIIVASFATALFACMLWRSVAQAPAPASDAWQIEPWKLAEKNPNQNGSLMFYVSGADNTDGNVELIISGSGLINPAPKPVGIDDGGKPHNFVLISTTNSGSATMLVYHLETPDKPGFKIEQIGVSMDISDQIKFKNQKVHSDLRVMATAIESYFVDQHAYPATTDVESLAVDGQLVPLDGVLAMWTPRFRRTVFAANGAAEPQSLTTPIAYLSKYPDDPYILYHGKTYHYYSVNQPRNGRIGWILWSPGPDKFYGLPWQSFDPGTTDSQIQQWLLPKTYDPTNGMTSRGDIIRWGTASPFSADSGDVYRVKQ